MADNRNGGVNINIQGPVAKNVEDGGGKCSTGSGRGRFSKSDIAWGVALAAIFLGCIGAGIYVLVEEGLSADDDGKVPPPPKPSNASCVLPNNVTLGGNNASSPAPGCGASIASKLNNGTSPYGDPNVKYSLAWCQKNFNSLPRRERKRCSDIQWGAVAASLIGATIGGAIMVLGGVGGLIWLGMRVWKICKGEDGEGEE